MNSFRKNCVQKQLDQIGFNYSEVYSLECYIHIAFLPFSSISHSPASSLVPVRILVFFLCGCRPSSKEYFLQFEWIYWIHSGFLSCRNKPYFVIVPGIILNDWTSKTFDIKYIVLFIEIRKSPLANAKFALNTWNSWGVKWHVSLMHSEVDSFYAIFDTTSFFSLHQLP